MEVRACYAVAPVNATRVSSPLVAAVLGTLLTACTAGTAAGPGPVVVQGAMDVEIKTLAASLQRASEEHVAGWTFWRGTIDGYPVVVSKTQKGMENAAAATALAAERYHPVAIINQGTAGGHSPDLHVSDIVLGVQSINLGSFKTGYRARGAGIDQRDWLPLDLMRSEGSAGTDPSAHTMRQFHADEGLLSAAHSVRDHYTRGHVVDGVIGSSDVWNSELDRIDRFHEQYGTSAEEMEAAAAALVAGQFHIPFLGIRVLSNNVTNGEPYSPKVGEACQVFVREVVQAYIRQQKPR
jgi:adenosylhomocysteine nucleosidase